MNLDIVGLLTAALRPEGFRLLSAGDGETALALARAERPTLILLDWMMPGRTGLRSAAPYAPRPTAAASGAGGAPDLARGGGGHRGRVCGWRHRLPDQTLQAELRQVAGAEWLLRSQGAPAPAQPQPT